jgi:hypothetical protein
MMICMRSRRCKVTNDERDEEERLVTIHSIFSFLLIVFVAMSFSDRHFQLIAKNGVREGSSFIPLLYV